MRRQVDADTTLPETVDDIEPGDYIASRRYPLLLGRFLQRGDVGQIKGAYLIQCHSGRHDFIEADDVRILGWGQS